MDIISVVSEKLSLPRHHIGFLSKTRIVCIVSNDWLRPLYHGRLPSLQGLDVLGQAEAEQYLAGSCIKLPRPWRKITIKVIHKTLEQVSFLKDGPLYPTSVAKSLFEHLSTTAHDNYRNLWTDAYKRFGGGREQQERHGTQDFGTYIKQYLWRFQSTVSINLETPSPSMDVDKEEKITDPNVLPIHVYLESCQFVFLVQPYLPYTLSDIISYSPSVFNSSHMLTLFTLYQVLQAMKSFHEKGLSMGDTSMHNIVLDSKFWLYVAMPQIHSLHSYNKIFEREDDQLEQSLDNSSAKDISRSSVFSASLPGKLLGSSTPKREKGMTLEGKKSKFVERPMSPKLFDSVAKRSTGLEQLSSVHSPLDQGGSLCPEGEKYWTEACEFLAACQYRQYEVEDLPYVVADWVNRKITNFKYLMILNHLAGRKMGDPNNHPVLPWIMDFTSPHDGYRDLSMSKFRLNKGDSQLDFTYNTMPALSDDGEQVPHHVSDVLSDITYYVYKARRTPKSVLCSHVRTKWVPHEYPSSLQRLQEWTPDECIPEFYTDPTLFSSIHEDLPDLEIPNWCSSTQDFIIKHILALESEKISESLHQWIDLTFGQKLSGTPSIKAKNVYLQLVDQHKNLTNHGVVQLFTQPHPHRLSTRAFFNHHPPKVTRNVLQPQMAIGQGFFHDEQELLQEASSMGSFDILDQGRPETALITLPRTFCPHAQLDYIEAKLGFAKRTLHESSQGTQTQECSANEPDLPCIVSEDILRFSCLMCEMFLAPNLRMKDTHVSLSHRFHRIMKLSACDFSELPRPLHKAAYILLHQVQKKAHPYMKDEFMFNYPSVNHYGHPPPTPSMLLGAYTGLLPFPNYFSELYKCLCQLKQIDAEANHIQLSSRLPMEKASLLKHKEREKVPLIEQFLLKFQGKLGKEGLELMLPYIEELFQQDTTTVQAAWSFFGLIGRELGPQETAKRFLPFLTSLYTGENSSAKHVKLYHRHFLMQLMVRLGLGVFLSNFSTLLVEAVAGYKDFPLPSKYYNEELIEEMQREAELSERTTVWSGTSHPKSEAVATTNGLSGEGYQDEESSQSWDTGRDENTQGDVDDIEEEFPDNILLNEDDCGTEESKKKLSTDSISIGQVSNFSDESGDGDNGLLIGSCDRASIHSISNILDRSKESRDQSISANESDTGSLCENNDESAPVFESFSPIPDTDDHPHESKFDSGTGEESVDSAYDRKHDDESSEHTDLTIDVSDQMVRSETEDAMVSLSLASPAEIVNIRDISSESVKWLCHKLGPVLTAKHLSRNLIRMLALCFLGQEQLDNLQDPDYNNLQSSRLVIGDRYAQRVLECLGYVAVVYGEHVILSQYLPTIIDMVAVAQRRLTQRSESGLFGAMVLLKYVIPFFSVKSLMDNLDDTIVMDSLLPVIKMVTSPTVSFPGGVRSRSLLCHKVIDVLYVIGLRLGLEMTRKHLSTSMLKFFEAFAVVHGNSSYSANGQLIKSGSLSPPGVSYGGSETSEDSYLNIKMDPSSQEYKIGTPISVHGLNLETNSTSRKNPPNKYHSLTSLGAIDDKDDVDYRPSTKEGGLQELSAVFTPELALAAYIPLCRIFGSIHMEEHLPNDDLIRQLCSQQDTVMDQVTDLHQLTSDSTSASGGTEGEDTSVTGAIGRNVEIIGNRIQLNQNDRGTSPELNQFGRGYRASGILSILPDDLRCEEMEHSRQRHLRGNWLAYWEHELGLHERDTIFNFKQIKLQTFQGHTNSIRSLFVLDNENSFISASKDKTVKLWTATSSGDGSGKLSFQWSYGQHKKSVFSVAYVDSVRQVASCDSTVHIWDPFTGASITQLESSKYAPVVALTPLPPPSTLIVTATTEATLRFLDLRVSKYAHEFKCSVGSAGLIRCITVSPDGSWVAVGFSTGVISLIDVNSGILMGSWKAHDGEILQIKAYSKNKVVSSSFDQTMKLWNIEDGKEICTLKGPTEPVHCVCFYKHQILSATTANKIGVHTSVDDNASFTSTKLRSDTFKGVLTTMAILPLNRSLLLGADNGTIRLIC